jgi:protein SCO1/2
MFRAVVFRTFAVRAAMALAACAAAMSGAAAQARPAAAAAPLPPTSIYRMSGKWTSHDGGVHTLSSLRGQITVLAMVYTSCTMTCPLITSEMLAVQHALSPELRQRVRFVLASFDPARDSLPALRAHVAKMALDDHWLVMRASPADVRTLAVLLGVSYRQLPSGDFDHSNIITVLDTDGVVRFQSPRIPANRPALLGAVIAAARR